MPMDKTKIFEFQQNKKSDKLPFIIYEDLEYIKENIDEFKNNSENSPTKKVSKNIPSVFSMPEMSNYDYPCNIKDLAEEVKKQYACLGENTEKYIIFSVPIEKEIIRTAKNEKNDYPIYIYIYIYIYFFL